MRTSDQINEIAAAMAAAQKDMRPALKDATNPAYKSKYADLASVWDACRGPLTTHQLAVLQDATMTEQSVSVLTRIVHASGQWFEFGPLVVPMARQDAHGVGSAISYAKRYGLSAAIGVVSDDDDDGVGAVGRQEKVQVTKPAGYDDWLTDMTAVADIGAVALKAAWEKSSPAYRAYITETNKPGWELMKKRAQAVPA